MCRDKPNIVLIMTDQQRLDMVGSYGTYRVFGIVQPWDPGFEIRFMDGCR